MPMDRVFTRHLSNAKIRSTWRTTRFGVRTRCPQCDFSRKMWTLGDDRWRCPRCRKTFGLRTDTWISHVSYTLPEILELLYWFELDLSDHKIAIRVREEYYNVHRFYMRVRQAIQRYEDTRIQLMDGEVEVDESYFGPKFKNRRRVSREKLRKSGQVKRGRGAKDLKQAVFGIYERADGLVYCEPVEDVSRKTLQEIIQGRISIETTIYSDTWRSYEGLEERFAGHMTVDHGRLQYRNGRAFINGIEGFWGYAKERLLKYHGISPKNFLLYLKEIEYRFNHRSLEPEDFVKHMLHVLAC